MLVRDPPLAIDLAVANGRAPPHIDFPSVCPGCIDTVETVAKGHVIARRDVQVANLVANRALERGEPLLQALLAETDYPACIAGEARG